MLSLQAQARLSFWRPLWKHDLSLVCGELLPNYSPFPEGCGWYSGCQAQNSDSQMLPQGFQKGLTDPFPGPRSPTEGHPVCVRGGAEGPGPSCS